MTDATAAPPAPTSLGSLAERATEELATLDAELAEIELLINQATTEAGRHEMRRTQVAEKLAVMPDSADGPEALELGRQVETLTRRAAVMEAQVDVLKGKQRALSRFRDAIAGYAEALSLLAAGGEGGDSAADGEGGGAARGLPRDAISAQEDLRRDIARQMHDGPAQSLTNIALQAQIVERLVGKDEAMAKGELKLLISMVQQTLDATKTFIFDVRPMVLDDLGLVPTLRRAARDRGRRAGIPVIFESDGQDRRLAVDVESGLFRIVDDALVAYLAGRPDRVVIRMSWSDELAIDVAAVQDVPEIPAEEQLPSATADAPAALAAMIEERRAKALEAPAPVILPADVWTVLESRAEAIDIRAELLDEGSRVRLVTASPEAG
jgi:two-component system sensor histidine kinase DegS